MVLIDLPYNTFYKKQIELLLRIKRQTKITGQVLKIESAKSD